MAISHFLILVGVCLGLSLAQQCDQAIQDFHDCERQSSKRPGQGGQGGGDRPNFDEIKTKMDACFTSNGCDAPKFGGPGGHGPQQGGPQGGRAGRVGSGAGNDDRRKCFESVNNKTKDAMLSCMRRTNPNFAFPSKAGGGNDHHGPGGFGGPGGHGGPGGPGGGPGGPAGGPGGNGGPQKFLLDACKNNADNAAKVNACMQSAMPQRQKPDTDKMRQEFNARCDAKKACVAKLGNCKATMDQQRSDMCKCGQEVAGKRQEFQQQEPACSSQSQQPRPGGPPQGQKHDCNAQDDPCTKGFDAMMQEAQNHQHH